ncbi:MAG: hypothetical protein WBP41_03025 [Saprospiraceae bacterium]
MAKNKINTLTDFLSKIPSVDGPVHADSEVDGMWSVKFHIDIHHDLAWQVVQEMGSVINNLSLTEKLPAVFYPVSPPPYLNGGPDEFLSWVIETKDKDFTPDALAKWLEGRLPNPVDDPDQWSSGEE